MMFYRIVFISRLHCTSAINRKLYINWCESWLYQCPYRVAKANVYQVDGAVCTQWPQINVIISHNLDGWWAAEPAFVDEHFPSNRCDHQMSIGAKIHHQLQTKACSGQRASENGDENMRRSFINSNLNLRIFENGSIWFGWNFIARPLFNWMGFLSMCVSALLPSTLFLCSRSTSPCSSSLLLH